VGCEGHQTDSEEDMSHEKARYSMTDQIPEQVPASDFKVFEETFRRLTGILIEYAMSSNGYAARAEWEKLLKQIPAGRLEHHGRKIYSQNDEDGILEEICRRVGITPNTAAFVEIGVQDGLENNTLFLLYKGFRGLWIEAREKYVNDIGKRFRTVIESGRLSTLNARVTAENINELLSPVAPTTDVLSIDIDGNDFWVWKAMNHFYPPVVVIEYNAKFPPPLSIVQKYDPNFRWSGSDYSGASLCALAKLGQSKGYGLVACNITGSNAFFVRSDLIQDRFPYTLTPENLYQPCRYYLSGDCFRSYGHRPDFGPYETI
jgi:hypothetical protein